MAWIRACGGGAPAIPDGKTVTPINDVTIWQKCAGIANPTYTTVNQILADSGILSQLINSNNAVDYMVRSTSWASTICANQTAMQTIGANNYCSNTLLANSTWRTSITTSTYWQSVLNAKVPTMTSNTTPSGTCVASGGTPWCAFDGNTESMWGAGASNVWVGYGFTKDVQVCKFWYRTSANPSTGDYNGLPNNFKIEGSNNNSTWTTIQSFTAGNTAKEYSFNLSNANKYRYYRLYVNTNHGGSATRIMELQFYGREDV